MAARRFLAALIVAAVALLRCVGGGARAEPGGPARGGCQQWYRQNNSTIRSAHSTYQPNPVASVAAVMAAM